jgi:hypothetical protein
MTWFGPIAALVGRFAEVLVRVLPAALAYLAGLRGARARQLDRTVKIQDEQLRQAGDRPRDRRELARRLRSDGL